MNRYSNLRDAAPWEAGGLETGPGDRECERVPTDANFLIISRAVYYFSVTNNLEFNTSGDGRGALVVQSRNFRFCTNGGKERYNFNKILLKKKKIIPRLS